jgi:UDP-N-acetylmuramate dehydrogenase
VLGVEVKDFIEFVEYFDFASGAIKKLFKDECQFGYRDSIFKSGNLPLFFITKVGFKVRKNSKLVNTYSPLDQIKAASPRRILETVIETRQAKLPDPKDLGNAGSFFKNPVISKRHYQTILEQDTACPSYPVDTEFVKLPAAYLIDQLGFKGVKWGGIACHDRQPLVLVNLQNGSGKELIELAQNICQKVWERFSIKLENEVRLIGKQGLISL